MHFSILTVFVLFPFVKEALFMPDFVVQPFLISKSFGSVTVKRGECIQFNITYGGIPHPDVTWEVDGRKIEDDGNRTTIYDNYVENALTIRKTVRNDSGKYKLFLNNSVGELQVTAEVVVMSEPGPPIGPLAILVVRAKFVIVQWNKPNDFGGTNLGGYILEKLEAGNSTQSGRWQHAGKTGPTKTKLKIKELSPEKFYRFRIIAYNIVGRSKPLVAEVVSRHGGKKKPKH